MLNNPEGNLDQPQVDPLWAVNGKYSVCKYNFRLLTSPLILSSNGAAEEQNNVLCSAYVGHSSRTHLAVTFFCFLQIPWFHSSVPPTVQVVLCRLIIVPC